MLTLVAVSAYACWCGLAWVMQERILFAGAWLSRNGQAASPGHGIERMWIDAGESLRVEGWFLRGRGRDAARPGPAVLFAHGNGERIDDWPRLLAPYREWGVSILLAEYRGYGRSGGTPSQASIVSDMERFHDWLAARPEVDAARVFFHGRSLGGGVVAALAERRSPAALILESTFTGVATFFRRFGIPPALCRNPFATDRTLQSLTRPVLILHGSRDEVVPVDHGRRLHELAPRSTYVEMEGGHNDFPADPDAYWSEIRAFLVRSQVVS